MTTADRVEEIAADEIGTREEPTTAHEVSFRDLVASASWLLVDGLRTFGKFVAGLVLALFLGGMLYSAVLNAYSWLQVLFLVLFVGLDGFMLAVLFDAGRRTKVALWLIRDDVLGWHYPIVAVATIFILLAIGIFATSAVLFQNWGLLDLRDPSCAPPCVLNAAGLSNFYLWHLAEAVPLLRVNETLRWSEPFVYRGALAGWLVLGFKIAVILPLVQSFRVYWQVRSKTPRLRLRAWPRVTSTGTPVAVSWASAAPPAGYVFHVFVERPNAIEVDLPQGRVADEVAGEDPSEAQEQLLRDAVVRARLGEHWETWLTNQTEISGEFTVWEVGAYRFQARWVDTTTGEMSNTPRTVSVRVRGRREVKDASNPGMEFLRSEGAGQLILGCAKLRAGCTDGGMYR